MTLSIQNDAGAEGAGDTINPATVQIDLGQITADLNIGQGTTTGDLIQVTYTGVPGSAPATRINQLVNTNFGVNNPDIVILGTGPQFTALDGTVLCGNGFTARPNTTDNPTNSVYIVYDTTNGNGGGILVRAPGGAAGTFTSPTPGPVVLYHELSHALRMANGTQQADDEIPAINDENVLRPILNIALRDPQPPHDGSAPSCPGPPGPGTCCVVASISTGSIYSREVNALRAIRDGVLRRSDIGFDFFDRLHYDYYAFSPEVCRMMARSRPLQDRIREYFVGPLARILTLIHDHLMAGVQPAELGVRFAASVADADMAALGHPEVDEALALLGTIRCSDTPLPAAFAEFARFLDGAARSSPFIAWALLDPVELYTRALGWRLDGMPAEELGVRLGAALDNWAARMPLTEAWEGLSPLGLQRELAFIRRVLARTPELRASFGQRLAAILGDDAARVAALHSAGFAPSEETA